MTTSSNPRILQIISLLLIMTLFCPFADGKIFYVDDDGQADFDNIQDGIDTTVDGDTVVVLPGEYVVTVPITLRGKTITVISEAGPENTTIRMGTPTDPMRGSVVVFENNETDASILEGFTITGGTGSWVTSVSASAGGGIFFDASSGTIKNCVIVQNRAEYAGGVLCAYLCSPKLISCIIAENSVTISGGGVFVWSRSSLTINNCFIKGNLATDGGGGIQCWENASINMTYCNIMENFADVGGGVFGGENSLITMSHCVIINNTAYTGSGGLETWHRSSADVSNCVIARNTALGWGGGGVNCSIRGSATIVNSILWGNTAPKGHEIWIRDAGTLSISYSNVSGGQAEATIEGGTIIWGVGNIDNDPLFADPNNGDYHLKSQAGRWEPKSQSWIFDDVTSPSIDAGDPNSSIGSEPFPNSDIINMGAYGGTDQASKSLSGKSTYIFMPEQSMVIQTGGIAGVNWTYTLTGQFQLTIDFSAGKAWFSNIEAAASDESAPDRKLDLNEVFNLTGLTGTIDPDGSIQFTGQATDGSDIILDITLSDESVSLKAQTTPPPNSADFFIFDLDAAAQRKYGGGTGEPNNPYLIYTAEHLNALGAEPNDWYKHFKLMADIDLAGYSYDQALIAPDIDTEEYYFQGVPFAGVFDGNGHTISHLTITGVSCLGLFGELAYGAELKDLGVKDVNISGSGDFVGGLLGRNSWGAVVTRCYSTGTVNGDDDIGGLVGSNHGNITQCYSTSAASGDYIIGGLLGGNEQEGTLTNCYSTGPINGNDALAGLLGFNLGEVTHCYCTGTVTGNQRVSGLVGWNYGAIASNFWDIQTSGWANMCGSQEESASGCDDSFGLVTADMQMASTFLNAGWDFVDETTNGTDDIWRILEEHDYPRLWWENDNN